MAQTFNYHNLPVEAESVSQVTATNSVDLGTVRVYAGEEYVYCYNAGALSMSPGQFGVLSANSGYSVTISSVAAFDFPIGFCKHATIGAGSYGWLMTRGFMSVRFASNTGASINDVIYAGSQGNVLSLGNVTISLTCSIIYMPIGYVVSAAATIGASTATVAQAYVRVFGS